MADIRDQDTSLISADMPLVTQVASLFFTHGEKAGVEMPLSRETFFIGRSGNNNLQFDDKSVSRKHAVINLIDGEFTITDLNSLKGTYVNSKKIDEVLLKDGDFINIGENRMQFRILSGGKFWTSARKIRWPLYAAFFIFGLVISAAAFIGFYDTRMSPRLPDDVVLKIEQHYDSGIDFYNREHDVQKARDEWKKIIELDPNKRTDFAVKAEKLLKSTEEAH